MQKWSQANSRSDSYVTLSSASLFFDFDRGCVGPKIQESIAGSDDLNDHDDPNKMQVPISGYELLPLQPLEKAVMPLISFLGDMRRYVYIAKQNTHETKDGLTRDESASIHLYTMEWSTDSHSLYFHLNRALRAKNRRGLIPWFPYLKLFLTALFKLPSQTKTLWRGIRADVSAQYRQGATIIWWGFSSCTTSLSVLQSDQFVGDHGTRTIFSIEALNGKSIRGYSIYNNEDEVLLLPGTYLKVMGEIRPGSDLTIIQLKEQIPPFPLIAPPFRSESEQEMKPVDRSRPLERETQPTETESASKMKKRPYQPHKSPQKIKSKPLPKKTGSNPYASK